MPQENYRLKHGVVLAPSVRDKIKKIADDYHAATGRGIVVTSGTRTPKSQATAMYAKLDAGDRLRIYRNQKAADAIRELFDDGKKAVHSREQIVESIAEEIASQVKRGVFLSKHLKHGAVDVRSRDMTQTEREAFRKAAKAVAVIVLLEITPPHFHLQF